MGLMLKEITAPADEPIDLATAKSHCRIDIAEENDLIEAWITAAREIVELYTRRALITQTLEIALDAWPSSAVLTVPRPPLQSVTSIKYLDTDDTEYTMTATDYVIDTYAEPGRIGLQDGSSWPADVTLRVLSPIRIRFVAGFGDSGDDVPKRFKQAIALTVGHWYENREAVQASGAIPKELPYGVKALLARDRALRFP